MDNHGELLQTPDYIARQLADDGSHHHDVEPVADVDDPIRHEAQTGVFRSYWKLYLTIFLLSVLATATPGLFTLAKTAWSDPMPTVDFPSTSDYDWSRRDVPTIPKHVATRPNLTQNPPPCDDSVKGACVAPPSMLPVFAPPFGTADPDGSVVTQILNGSALKKPRIGSAPQAWSLPVAGSTTGAYVTHAVCVFYSFSRLIEVGTAPEAPGLVLARAETTNRPPAPGDCVKTDLFWAKAEWFPAPRIDGVETCGYRCAPLPDPGVGGTSDGRVDQPR